MGASPALFLFLVAAVPGIATTTVAPTYSCGDGKGASYRIWLTEARRAMEWDAGGKTFEIKLAAANLFRAPANPGEPLVSNGWHPEKLKGEPLDLGYEVTTQFLTENDRSFTVLGLVVAHQERTELDCRAHGNQVSLEYFDKRLPPEVRLPDRVSAVAGLRGPSGELTAVAAATLDSVVRRFYHSPSLHRAEAKQSFFKNITPAIVRVAPNTISSIGKKLPVAMKPFWVELLEATKYRYFPETERYIGWIKEGARPEPQRDLDSVRAGFLSFVRSPLFKQKDLQEFLTRSVLSAVAGLDEHELNRVSARMTVAEKAFLKSVWVKATGRKTADDFPEIAKMVQDLNRAVTAPNFDPVQVKDRLMVFFASSLAANPEAKGLYVQAASPVVKRLSPRQVEDLNVWLNEAGQELLREMLR